MADEEKIPDPEQFIKEVESTIDSLFEPSKKIEINPVTGKVREPEKEIQAKKDQEHPADKEPEPEPLEEIVLELEPERETEEVDASPKISRKIEQKKEIDRKATGPTIPLIRPEGKILEFHEPPYNQERIRAALEDLTRCIEKILSVELLLSGQKKGEKLYKFFVNIRSRIENAIRAISDELGLEAPEVQIQDITPEDIGQETPREPPSKTQRPLFEEVYLVNWDGRTIGLIPEEICFIGRPKGLGKRISGNETTFALKALKVWPWSKIRPLLKGELAERKEEELEGLMLPVIRRQESPVFDIPHDKAFSVVLLFKDGRGCAIFIEGDAKRVEIKESWKWEERPSTRSPWLGILKTQEGSIPVLSIESVSDIKEEE